MVGVLILVHHYVFKLAAVEIQNVLVPGKQRNGKHDNIVKIKGVVGFELFLIQGVNIGYNAFLIVVKAVLFHFLRGFKFVFCA